MARLAYVRGEDDLHTYLARAGYALSLPFDQDGTQGFIAENETTGVLAFRGTEALDPRDVIADSDAVILPEWPSGGHVHKGFATALRRVWGDVQPRLPRGKKLLFTGHSLGAAIATLAATRERPAALYTFGSPHVGDAEFARAADRLEHHRYVDCADAVCTVLATFERLKALAGLARLPIPSYQHCGRIVFIDRRGLIREAWSPQQMDAERAQAELEYRPTVGAVLLRALADHAPLNYSSAVLGVRQQA